MQADFSRFTNTRIINAHLHFENLALLDETHKAMSAFGIDSLGIVSPAQPGMASVNPQAMCFKAAYPETTYIFGGPDYSAVKESSSTARQALSEQAQRLLRIGFDGVKLLESKPSCAHFMPFAIDDPVYEAFFEVLEAATVLIIWHVADPEEFWDPNHITTSARKRGWDYTREGFSAKEKLYAQAGRVLQRHPKLTVIFAHFYFLSADLDRAGRLLDKYANVHLDITPGSEMFLNFSKQPEKTRNFFIRHRDRIVFGDDTMVDDKCLDYEGILAKLIFMRRFLETEDRFEFPHADKNFLRQEGQVIGLGLPEETLNAIYSGNFLRLAGEHPRPLDMEEASAECRRIGEVIATEYNVAPGTNVAIEAERRLTAPSLSAQIRRANNEN